MPFFTDTTWPAGLRTIFDSCRQEIYQLPLGNRYLGPYIKLLTYCFGTDSFDFFVAPQAPELDLEMLDLGLYLIVFDAHCRPLLIVDIRDDEWVNRADLRVRADSQIRLRFGLSLREDCPLPRLWGLSLLGTSLRVYVCDATGKIEPPFMHHPIPSHVLPHDHLRDSWKVDILSQEGFTKMKEVVQDIISESNAKALERA
ncbi:hypothetical protein OG21DRAFT_759451 [Imleria badia]|nr:hypothetical protein OG21DRAFT_759451 [Imleria badia]